MKNILLTASLFFASGLSANIGMPEKMGDGFKNVNNRKEYSYHQAPNEKIWHEFGRPFWKASEAKTTEVEPKKIEKPMKIARVMKDSDKDGVRDRMDQCPTTMAGTKVNRFGCKVIENRHLSLDVLFKLNKSQLRDNYTHAVDRLAESMKEDTTLKVEVQGHTDTTGSIAFNRMLSTERAIEIKKYLVKKHGIDEDRILARGYASTMPVTTNETLSGRKENRRVDVAVLKN